MHATVYHQIKPILWTIKKAFRKLFNPTIHLPKFILTSGVKLKRFSWILRITVVLAECAFFHRYLFQGVMSSFEGE